MIDQTRECVIDAGVGIKLFVTEEWSDHAALLFDRYTQANAGELAVPDLFYSECASILWKHVRRFSYPVTKAKQDIQFLQELVLVRYATRDLASDALGIAIDKAISVYDACYVALAKQRNAPLVTADQRLVRVFADSGYRVLWLGALDFSESSEYNAS